LLTQELAALGKSREVSSRHEVRRALADFRRVRWFVQRAESAAHENFDRHRLAHD
jgi:hypothetical protein